MQGNKETIKTEVSVSIAKSKEEKDMAVCHIQTKDKRECGVQKESKKDGPQVMKQEKG